MRAGLVPYALVLFAFVVSLPFLNENMQLSSKSAPITGFAVAPSQMPSGNVDGQTIAASYSNGLIYVSVSDDLVWSIGYYYDYVKGEWTSFQFKEGDGWIKNSATANMRPNGLRPGTNYIAVYTCSQLNSEWKCGCLSENDCGHWLTKNFYVSFD
jgi:hypothetical protein